MALPNYKNILVIGDLHTPFTHKGYLAHCKLVAKQFKTTHTIFIGDIVDSHASSFYPSDPDGMSPGDELSYAKDVLKDWHKSFPHADVISGNHCRIVARKAYSVGLSKHWMRSLEDVLEVPTWRFSTKLTIDKVLYIHGEGVTARTKALRVGKSVVQGHRHTEGYLWINQNEDESTFGMQVGTGIDNSAYAFAYAKDHPSPVMSCGVVLNHGTIAHIIPMSNASPDLHKVPKRKRN